MNLQLHNWSNLLCLNRFIPNPPPGISKSISQFWWYLYKHLHWQRWSFRYKLIKGFTRVIMPQHTWDEVSSLYWVANPATGNFLAFVLWLVNSKWNGFNCVRGCDSSQNEYQQFGQYGMSFKFLHCGSFAQEKTVFPRERTRYQSTILTGVGATDRISHWMRTTQYTTSSFDR